ncbi:MAG: PEP-CTERM system histidine kinase PrsK [Pseudomonadales bacterium]|nr:PEP-CTERM system histidine kinase PrsK [Pseudomonadales bacterium]
MQTIAAYSPQFALGVYVVFFVFCFVNLVRGVTGKALLLSSVVSLFWVISLLSPLRDLLAVPLEIAALFTWHILLFRAIGFDLYSDNENQKLVRNIARVLAATATVTTLIWFSIAFKVANINSTPVAVGMLVLNIGGLVLIEQFARNTLSVNRWRVRYLNIGLGILFVYGSVLWSIRLGLGDNPSLLQIAQPAVFALSVPFIIIASLRNRTNRLRFNLSREFVFRTGVLAMSGGFLIALGLMVYLAQTFAGDVGLTLALFMSILLLGLTLAIAGSTRFRSVTRVLFTKTFFESRHDYRSEWTRLTARLVDTNPDYSLEEQVLLSCLAFLYSKNASLWILKDNQFELSSTVGDSIWPPAMPTALGKALSDFYESHDWVLDTTSVTGGTNTVMTAIKSETVPIRFVIPLMIENSIVGICFADESEAITGSLDWEDYDALKLIGRQCASFLALNAAQRSLVENEQFAALAQMSAFLVHDIKTIAAQLSLMLENAEKHKGTPAFVDDMLATTQNSVTRMQKILQSLSQSHSNVEMVVAGTAIQEWLDQTQRENHRITFVDVGADNDCQIPVGFITAINHLVQNALESSQAATVALRLHSTREANYISVHDNGPGMPEDFVRNELFKPFRTSKGVSGMGIGAYQAKFLIEKNGGHLAVSSTLGQGTEFTITYSRKESPSVR